MNAVWADASALAFVGRILIVGFFLIAGVSNLARPRIRDHIDRMRALNVPFPQVAHWSGMILKFVGCGLILADWQPDVGVYCLMLFTIAATAIFHRFWTQDDPAKRNFSRLTFLSNIGILGGLALLRASIQ